MPYEFIVIDSIICDFYKDVMYDEGNPYRDSLLGLQEKSANRVADKKLGLFIVTSNTKELIENKYSNSCLPISLGCLMESCAELDILLNDEADSIIKASALLKWKKANFCVLTGNSLLKTRLSETGFEVYDLSQVNELFVKI